MTELLVRVADIQRKATRAKAVERDERDDPFIARLQRFADFTAVDLNSLHAVLECEQRVKKRRELVLEGDVFGKLGFVKDGFAVRYKLLRNGKRQILSFLLPGDVVGLPGSFLDRAVHSVVAVTDMTLQMCALDALVALCCRRPKFGLALSWLAAQDAALYAERVIDIGRRRPMERLAHFLLETHARLAMVRRAGASAFELPVTQEMISDALRLSVPHLNRTLAQLRAERLIAVSERRIEIIDRPAMERLAQFQPISPARIPFSAEAEMH